MTKNTSKFEQLQQRRQERSLVHEDFVRLSFAKPIGKLQYRDIEKNPETEPKFRLGATTDSPSKNDIITVQNYMKTEAISPLY